jgi:hypothetical protein
LAVAIHHYLSRVILSFCYCISPGSFGKDSALMDHGAPKKKLMRFS